MTKLLVIPKNKEIESLINLSDAFLFGIIGYSVNTNNDISLEELKYLDKCLKENNKELFISLNKNMINSDIDQLKEILKFIDTLNIKGIFYADTCFINLKKELNLKTKLVWSNEHLTTNYATINFWNEYGVDYTYVSGEITKQELIEIKNNSKAKLIVPIFGHLPMFVSFRHAVKNYLEYFDLKDNSNLNYITNENQIYPIKDNELGTTVYSNYILDGYEEYKELDVDYVTLNEFNINRNIFIKVLEKYNGQNTSYELKTDKGFLYKATVYKVKK